MNTLRSSQNSILTNHKMRTLRMYLYETLLLTNRPPPMSPPISHTYRVICSLSSFVPLGKKSRRLAMMLMKAVGNRMRPIRRAHFPVQHISSYFLLLYLLWFSVSSLRSSLYTTTLSAGIFPTNRRDEVMVRTRGGGGGTLARPNPTHQIQPAENQSW